MKKFLVLSAMLGAMMFAAPSVEAKSATASSAAADPQMNMRVGQPGRGRWNNRRPRVVTTTRIIRVSRYRYREVIRVTYFPNGRTRTQVISRTRLSRW